MINTILVVEDDENILEVVDEYLKDAGFIVITANDGQKAYNIIKTNSKIDLFILDIMLPIKTGIELLNFIREDKTTPVIMLTALDDEYTQILSFDGKADDYISKPFSPKLLVKRVEAILRRSGKINNLLKIQNISIDVESYQAFENEKSIILTLKELELLKILMKNPNKVLSRQQLLNYVWGYDYFGDDRIIDVHIKNLRKKFETDFIITVKGVGYKINKNVGDVNV